MTATQATRLRPGLLFDLPVGVLLLIGWFSLPAYALHIVAGIAFAAIVLVHLFSRPGGMGRGFLPRSSPTNRSATTNRRTLNWVLLVSAVVMTVSGFVQWAGVQAMVPVHGGSSAVLIVVAGVHLWQRRATLAARIRRRPADRTG